MSGVDAGKVRARQCFEQHYADLYRHLGMLTEDTFELDEIDEGGNYKDCSVNMNWPHWEAAFEAGAAFAQGSQATPDAEYRKVLHDELLTEIRNDPANVLCGMSMPDVYRLVLEHKAESAPIKFVAAAQPERPGPTPIFPPRVEYAHRVECPERHPVLIGEGRCTCESVAPQSAPGPQEWNGPHPWNIHQCSEVEGAHLPIEGVCKEVMPSGENASKPAVFSDRNRISATAGDASAQTRATEGSVAPQSAPGPQWISVEERLPVEDRPVWMFNGMCGVAVYRQIDGWWLLHGAEEVCPLPNVTYWQELPAPPGSVAPPEAERQPLGMCETEDWPHLQSDGTAFKRPHEKRGSCINWRAERTQQEEK
jgi:Protein of unknown function (DUF551)